MKLPSGEEKESGEYLFDYCPFCAKEKHFYWNLEKCVGWCQVCHSRVIGYRKLLEVVRCDYEVEYDDLDIGIHELELSCIEINAWLNDRSKWYLIGRGVTQEMCYRIPITLNVDKNYIRIPISGVSPELPVRYLKRYYLYADSKWYLEGGGWDRSLYHFSNVSWESQINNSNSLLITEGIFDLLSQNLHGISLLGTEVSNALYTKYLDKTWLIWLDPDAAGYSCTNKIIEQGSIRGFKTIDLTTLINKEPKRAPKEIIKKVKQLCIS